MNAADYIDDLRERLQDVSTIEVSRESGVCRVTIRKIRNGLLRDVDLCLVEKLHSVIDYLERKS